MDENPRISDLRKKIEKDPGSRLFAQLAEELRKEGRLEEAIQVAYEGLSKHPAYPSARLTLARALLDSGRASEARPELEQIVKAAPDNILAGRLLGEALDALGDLPAALKQIERTLMFSPGDKTMVAHVADLKARLQAPAPSAAPAPPPAAVPFDAPPAGAPVAAPSMFASETPAPSIFANDSAPAPSLFGDPPATAPSIFADESAPAPSLFGDEAAPAPSVFGDEAAAAPSVFGDETSAPAPSLFADDAAPAPVPAWTDPPPDVPPTLEMPVVSAATIPASIEAPEDAEADAATLPFALADVPPDFSESSASLPAFQFEERAPSIPEPEPVAEAAPEPPPTPIVAPAPVPPPAPPVPVFSLALDRDLASGTISPGAFNMAELQKHFEAIAAAERAAAAGNAAPPAPPAPAPPVAPPTVVDTAASAPTLPFRPAPEPAPAPPVPAFSAAPEETYTYNSGEFESPSMDTADTMAITPPEGGFALPAVPEPEVFAFDESPAAIDEPASAMPASEPSRAVPVPDPDPDLGSQTLPLTSLTLADLYLQQGLKAEAAAVLSQVVREEPANAQARSKLADVSAAVAGTLSEPAEHFAEEGARPEPPMAPPSRPRTRSEIREATLAGLRAFQGAIEREALEQKATEIRAL